MPQSHPAEFHGTPVNIIDHAGRLWLTSEEVGRCLGYNEANASAGIRNLYNRNRDEFTEEDTCRINLMRQGQNREMLMFSETGCRLLAFFSNTDRAKSFRAWAKQALAAPAAASMAPTPSDAALVAMAQVLSRVDRLCGVVEKLIETLPAILSAQRPRVRRPPIFEKDLPLIFALREQGATLTDIVRSTGFGQTAVWYVLEGRYAIMPGGRVKKVSAPTDVVSAIVRRQGGDK